MVDSGVTLVSLKTQNCQIFKNQVKNFHVKISQIFGSLLAFLLMNAYSECLRFQKMHGL